jgi:hypothetical protein
VTGVFDRDEYWRPTDRAKQLGLEAVTTAVAATEPMDMDDGRVTAGYRNERLERVEKAVVAGTQPAALHTIKRGQGAIIWCPLPVELAEAVEPTVAVYRAAAARAGVTPPVEVNPVDPGIFVGAARFGDQILVSLASETSVDRNLDVRPKGAPAGISVTLPAQRALLLLLDARSGALLAKTGGS